MTHDPTDLERCVLDALHGAGFATSESLTPGRLWVLATPWHDGPPIRVMVDHSTGLVHMGRVIVWVGPTVPAIGNPLGVVAACVRRHARVMAPDPIGD